MPTYDYMCTDETCDHHWEAEHSISADPIKECPLCKKETAKRLISGGSNFILKGGGWFSDSYSGSSNAK